MAKKSTPPDLSALTRGELEGVVLTLWERLEALESKVAKNSRKSSQPPSSDGLRKTNSLREPSGNKPGAQPGHKGDTLKRLAQPSRIDTHQLPEQCENCGFPLDQETAEIAERRQVIDTPVVAVDAVEHRVLALRCVCGQRHRSAFPASVTRAVQYAPNVRVLGVRLTQGHLLRELLYVQELTGERWPARMSELLLRANELREAALRTFYDTILTEGERRHPARLKSTGKAGRVKQSVAFNLLQSLCRHADAVLLFVSDPAVPFTNNLGERAIRMPKVKQKISVLFRTLLGAQNFCAIRSCFDTLRKQGHGMLAVLHAPLLETRFSQPRLNSYDRCCDMETMNHRLKSLDTGAGAAAHRGPVGAGRAFISPCSALKGLFQCPRSRLPLPRILPSPPPIRLLR